MSTLPATVPFRTLGKALIITLLAVTVIGVGSGIVWVNKINSLNADWQVHERGAARKSVFLGLMRGSLGYGGMIHNLKNYVLRGDAHRLIEFQKSLFEIKVAISGYRTTEHSEQEKAALADIEAVLEKYQEAAAMAEILVEKNIDPRVVDRNIVVDDAPAFAALRSLDNAVVALRQKNELGITDQTSSLKRAVLVSAGGFSLFLVLLTVTLGWFTRYRLVVPLERLVAAFEGIDPNTTEKTRLPMGDPKGKNELDLLAGAGNRFLEAVDNHLAERKQAEEAAKASEARLAEILDIAPEAVITVGADMNIQLFNQGAERIFGHKADEILGRPLDMLMPEYHRDDHRKHVQGFDNSGDTFRLMDRRQEITGLRKDGTEFPAAASVSKLDIGGERIFTVMLWDITERKKAQEALAAAKREAEHASRAKSEFLAAMSHDLRTPLNAILGFSDILSHQYFGPIDDKYREYAEDIKASGEHLLTLVNDILDLSTIEAGKQSLVKEKLSTMEIITECERIVEDKARSHGIDLVTEVPEDLPPLYADRRASKQILLNLLSNAVKFTPQGGRITVSATASKKNTTLKIADTGKGIPPEKLPGLTDPFTRADADPYLTEPGWGLGLTITKSLVELHDGTLDIKSRVGKGTTVTVTFPSGAA